MGETCCDSKHYYGKYGTNMTEGTLILQRVKTSSTFLLVSKYWYKVPEAQTAVSRGRTFWRIFSQPFQLSEENVKPGPAGHSATIILYSQTAGTLIIETSITLSKTVSHRITAPKICIHNNVERPPVLYTPVALKWIQWRH